MKPFVILAALGGIASAQVPSVAHDADFSVERLTPAPSPGGAWQVESADVPANGAPFLSISSWIATRPLVVTAVGTDAPISVPVEDRAGVDLGVAFGLLGRAQLSLSLPFVAAQAGDRLRGLDLPGTDANRPLAAAAFGDLRLGAKAQLWRPRRDHGLGLAADLILTLPTGDDTQFAGDRGVGFEARAIASYRRGRWWLAANAGPRFRSAPVMFISPRQTIGQELDWGAAGSVAIARRWTGLVEVAGAWGGSDGPSPVEARAGARWRIDRLWAIGGALGLGVGGPTAIGAPAFRALFELRYEPRPVADQDGDGIPDVADLCPGAPEDRDGFQDEDGCPDPDNDQDGIPDLADKCPNDPEDHDGFHDADGCPDPDNDGDGIPDQADRCPFEAEDKDGFMDADGCPDKDNDGDGILDADDLCPDEPEDKDGFQDADGCPDPDNDQDGVPDAQDRCPNAVEDRDGFEDEDGCPDLDNDRDGVPDDSDRCPNEAGLITSPSDTRTDGCPHGAPMATANPDGTIALTPAGRAALDAENPVAIRAVAIAAQRAGWSLVVVTVGPNDQDRGNRIARELWKNGVRSRVDARADAHGVTVSAG